MEKQILPLLPLRGILVFPHMVLHLDVGRQKSVEAVDFSMAAEHQVFLATQKQAQVDEPQEEDIYSVGTVAEIKQLVKLPGGAVRVLVEGKARAEIAQYLKQEPFFEVEIEPVEEYNFETNSETDALMRSLVKQFEQYVKSSKKVSPEVMVSVMNLQNPSQLADTIASHLSLRIEEKQEILENLNVMDRMEKLLDLVNRELEVLELERQIGIRVRKQMEKAQKEYYLREQIKAINHELGDNEDKAAEVEEYREKIAQADLPNYVEEKMQKELDRLAKMPPMAAESSVVRNYLDWVLDLPWSRSTKDRIDLNLAETILDEDHYGLKKVKERILEYLAIRQLTKKIKGPIICFVGPPGVGKTSLGRSIARALKRKFVRISLGGVKDEAEIRGHRRTYVGAMPGRIIQGMKTAGSKNPIFLLDEIDKMSNDFRGDPSSALLEVLDPEQNNTFSDHYIELPYDLSNVLFITTANVQHNIPRPLQDRMEIIEISGYTEEEKLQIALRHLLPKQIKEHGLTEQQIQFSEKAILRIIQEYTRESGVRSLERSLASLCRKAAKKIVSGETKKAKITAGNLESYLGGPRYHYGLAEAEPQIGLATGMAWTEVGGDTLVIEVSVYQGSGKLTLTGKLGDVMKESAQAAFSFVRSRAEMLQIKPEAFEKCDFHIHVPEGAIPKDGPSAGITIASSIASALTERRVRHDFSMTGEITLRGRVLPVGGIKEKVLAAHRAGIKEIVLPQENAKDLEDIPNNVKKQLTFHLVENMDQVLELVLLDGAVADAN